MFLPNGDGRVSKPTLRILSLGAGVQSTTVLMMALHGEIERPDCAIFADTGWEPKRVYEHLKWLIAEAKKYDFTIHVASKGNIRQDVLDACTGKAKRASNPPLFIKNEDGKKGMIRRSCTIDYKVNVVKKKVRELLGLKPRQRIPKGTLIHQIFGISLDEVIRMRTSMDPWIENIYPLIDLRMTRHGCLKWMVEHGYAEPPKSSCIGCPYHSDSHWREMKMNRPDEFAEAVEWDHALRSRPGVMGLKNPPYLHSSLKPLDEVDFENDLDKGQQSLFGNDCEGMCGV